MDIFNAKEVGVIAKRTYKTYKTTYLIVKGSQQTSQNQQNKFNQSLDNGRQVWLYWREQYRPYIMSS